MLQTLDEGLVTWTDKRNESAVDYILVNEGVMSCMIDVWIDESREISSRQWCVSCPYKRAVLQTRDSEGGSAVC